MFLFKLKTWNYIQHYLGFEPFSPETVLFFMLYFISYFYELLTFYARINKDDYYYNAGIKTKRTRRKAQAIAKDCLSHKHNKEV